MSAVDLLLTRRSVAPFALIEPGPSTSEIEMILTAACRVPDHGKLAPWRFILVEGANRTLLADKLAEAVLGEPGADAERVANDKRKFQSPLVIAVVSRSIKHPKIPEWEQVLSAGAVCMNLLLMVHALGYAGSWLTGRAAYDASAAEILGLGAGERFAGFIHIGTAAEPPMDRPRPELTEIVTKWAPQT